MKKAVSLYMPIVLFSCFCLSAHARVIKGRVLDATTKQAVAYASVTVLSLPDSAVVVDHATTGDDGAFVLHKVKDGGDGYMRISSLGYCTRKLQVSAVDTLGTVVVMLQPDRKLLDEVVVLGQKKLVKLTHQGLSYSMADDPKCQAEDLLTAMRRVPMVTVDGVGRLTVKGGSNYTIYMNGHPFRIANQNPSQVLGSIPAANIQKVEIITNPDASYSAEAGTTIINIVTTGRKVLGQSLLLSLQAETKPKGNGSISYNLVTRPVKLSLAYDYDVSNEHKQPVAQLREATLPGLSSTLKGDARNEATFQHHTARLMLEAEIDSLNTIYADGHYRFGRGHIYVLRTNPCEFATNAEQESQLLDVLKNAAGGLQTKNNYTLRRGPYLMAAVVDEGAVSDEPLLLNGRFIDLFDPSLPIVEEKVVMPGEQAFLLDLDKVGHRRRPQVLAAASRQENELVGRHSFSFVARSPLNTGNVMRILLPREPKTIQTTTASTHQWDAGSHTLLLRFENDPEGVSVRIEW